MREEAAQEWRIIMEEKVLKKNKNGMAMLTLFIALYVAAIAAIVSGAIMTETAESAESVISIILIVIGVVYVGLGWIFFLGLKVLKPQEALVNGIKLRKSRITHSVVWDFFMEKY